MQARFAQKSLESGESIAKLAFEFRLGQRDCPFQSLRVLLQVLSEF